MLKALIIGADAVCPEYIFEHPERYPHLHQLIKRGASASYSAYVQKGYRDSYLSEMNWSSIYTGLAPWEHGIAQKDSNGIRRATSMEQFDGLNPFWQILNENGLSVGLWSAMCCEKPVKIDGYAVSVQHTPLEIPDPVRVVKRTLQVNDKDQRILNLISEEIPQRKYPLTLAQQGYTFQQLKQDPDLAWKAVEQYHFQDALENFQKELDFFFKAITDVQRKNPVDVLYFYTPSTDLIVHCCMYCDDCDVLIKAYQLLDEYVGKLMTVLEPEHVIVLSDHGMCNFKDLVQCSDEQIRREAFAARDEVLWLKNGYIAFEAHNGALLFTAHAMKGLFIAAGPEIRHTTVEEMRTLDIYPTILELLKLRVPDGRKGYVQNIFSRPVLNHGDLWDHETVQYNHAAVLQCWSPSITDIVLNELYIRDRFTKFTVVGEEKYREIFLHNPRVEGFVSHKEFRPNQFDAVYFGLYHETTGLTGHLQIC